MLRSKHRNENPTNLFVGVCQRNNLSYIIDHLRELKIWNYENIVKEIEKYEYYTDFRENSENCYNAVLRLKLKYLLDKLKRKRKSEYTIEECIEIIGKYKI